MPAHTRRSAHRELRCSLHNMPHSPDDAGLDCSPLSPLSRALFCVTRLALSLGGIAKSDDHAFVRVGVCWYRCSNAVLSLWPQCSVREIRDDSGLSDAGTMVSRPRGVDRFDACSIAQRTLPSLPSNTRTGTAQLQVRNTEGHNNRGEQLLAAADSNACELDKSARRRLHRSPLRSSC